MKTTVTHIDERERSVVVNAIGYALFSHDRDTHERDGVTAVNVTDDEVRLLEAAAERALHALATLEVQDSAP